MCKQEVVETWCTEHGYSFSEGAKVLLTKLHADRVKALRAAGTPPIDILYECVQVANKQPDKQVEIERWCGCEGLTVQIGIQRLLSYYPPVMIKELRERGVSQVDIVYDCLLMVQGKPSTLIN